MDLIADLRCSCVSRVARSAAFVVVYLERGPNSEFVCRAGSLPALTENTDRFLIVGSDVCSVVLHQLKGCTRDKLGAC